MEKYIATLSKTPPDKSFSSKKEIIKKYTWEISQNLEHIPWSTAYIEYLDRLSHIPVEVINHVDNVLNTNRSKKIFHADKEFKKISKKLNGVEYDNLYYNHQIEKIVSQNSNNETIKKKYIKYYGIREWGYKYPQDSFQNLISYSDILYNEDDDEDEDEYYGILSKKRVYTLIYRYCQMVERNVQLYNSSLIHWKSHLIKELFPEYHDVDFKWHERGISLWLTWWWVLMISLPSNIMDSINKINWISGKRRWFKLGWEWIIIIKDDGKNYNRLMAIVSWTNFVSNIINIITHELQHVYYNFYGINERNNTHRVYSYIYDKAKNEILAQMKWWEKSEYISMTMKNQKSYDYFYIYRDNLLKTAEQRIEKRKDKISKLEATNVPKVFIENEHEMLQESFNDKENILDDLKYTAMKITIWKILISI